MRRVTVGINIMIPLSLLPPWMERRETFRDRNPAGLVSVAPDAARRAMARTLCRPSQRRASISFLIVRCCPMTSTDGASRPFGPAGPAFGAPPPRRSDSRGRFPQILTEGRASALVRWCGGGLGNIHDVSTGRDVPHDVTLAFHAFWPDGDWMF